MQEQEQEQEQDNHVGEQPQAVDVEMSDAVSSSAMDEEAAEDAVDAPDAPSSEAVDAAAAADAAAAEDVGDDMEDEEKKEDADELAPASSSSSSSASSASSNAVAAASAPPAGGYLDDEEDEASIAAAEQAVIDAAAMNESGVVVKEMMGKGLDGATYKQKLQRLTPGINAHLHMTFDNFWSHYDPEKVQFVTKGEGVEWLYNDQPFNIKGPFAALTQPSIVTFDGHVEPDAKHQPVEGKEEWLLTISTMGSVESDRHGMCSFIKFMNRLMQRYSEWAHDHPEAFKKIPDLIRKKMEDENKKKPKDKRASAEEIEEAVQQKFSEILLNAQSPVALSKRDDDRADAALEEEEFQLRTKRRCYQPIRPENGNKKWEEANRKQALARIQEARNNLFGAKRIEVVTELERRMDPASAGRKTVPARYNPMMFFAGDGTVLPWYAVDLKVGRQLVSLDLHFSSWTQDTPAIQHGIRANLNGCMIYATFNVQYVNKVAAAYMRSAERAALKPMPGYDYMQAKHGGDNYLAICDMGLVTKEYSDQYLVKHNGVGGKLQLLGNGNDDAGHSASSNVIEEID